MTCMTYYRVTFPPHQLGPVDGAHLSWQPYKHLTTVQIKDLQGILPFTLTAEYGQLCPRCIPVSCIVKGQHHLKTAGRIVRCHDDTFASFKTGAIS